MSQPNSLVPCPRCGSYAKVQRNQSGPTPTTWLSPKCTTWLTNTNRPNPPAMPVQTTAWTAEEVRLYLRSTKP